MQLFRTRTHGTAKQIGSKFPLAEKKKLPARISGPQKTVTNSPSASILSFSPPSENKLGHIKAELGFPNIGTQEIEADVELVNGNDRIGQFDLINPKVYVEKSVPIRYLDSLALHETLEKYIHNLGIDLQTSHRLSEFLEHKAFRNAGRSEAEWNRYDAVVDELHNNLVASMKHKPGGHLVYISPEKFLSETMTPTSGKKSWSIDTLHFLKTQVKQGSTGTPIFLDYTKNWHGGPDYDGRKRALVSKQLGVRKLPVVVYGNAPQGGKAIEEKIDRAFQLLRQKQMQFREERAHKNIMSYAQNAQNLREKIDRRLKEKSE